MYIQEHPLLTPAAGSRHTLHSLHFDSPSRGKKVYIQASLHADEIPGMLVVHTLRGMLAELDAAGAIRGEIVLVPVANPVGLGQQVLGFPCGRFDLASGVNFNRAYPRLMPGLLDDLNGRLGSDPGKNVQLVRQAALARLRALAPRSETESLKRQLLMLAIDADIVLDLHCENQGVVHLYTGTPLALAAAPLAGYLGAQALLLARDSGDVPFDEACASLWWELAEHFDNLPCACLAVTIELRGEEQVSHQLARQDALAIIDFLATEGVIAKKPSRLAPVPCQATLLASVEHLNAPHAGVIVFLRQPGDRVEAGQAVIELIDPLADATTIIRAGVDGLLFARCAYRYARCGMNLAKIAGVHPIRSGKLLTA